MTNWWAPNRCRAARFSGTGGRGSLFGSTHEPAFCFCFVVPVRWVGEGIGPDLLRCLWDRRIGGFGPGCWVGVGLVGRMGLVGAFFLGVCVRVMGITGAGFFPSFPFWVLGFVRLIVLLCFFSDGFSRMRACLFVCLCNASNWLMTTVNCALVYVCLRQWGVVRMPWTRED